MHELDKKAVGNRIKEQREYLKYTREKLAEASSISANFIRNIEVGEGVMSVKSLIKLSKALKISTDYILFGNTDNSDDNDRLFRTLSACTGKQREALDSIVTEVIRTYDKK